jgi:DNA-binding XRE family transcriptional regulator
MRKADRYNPVPFDPKAAGRRWQREPAFADAYAAFEDEFAALRELLAARHRAGMTQAEVADRMGVAQSSVARIESSIGSRRHAPSLATLRRYADAVECVLTIALRPKESPKRSRASRKSGEASDLAHR